jgi:hypothetical protein
MEKFSLSKSLLHPFAFKEQVLIGHTSGLSFLKKSSGPKFSYLPFSYTVSIELVEASFWTNKTEEQSIVLT